MIAVRYHGLCEEIPHVPQVRSEHRVLGRAKTVRGGPAPKVNPPFVIYLPSSCMKWTAAAVQQQAGHTWLQDFDCTLVIARKATAGNLLTALAQALICRLCASC